VKKGLARHIVSFVFVFGVGSYAYYEYAKTKKSKNNKKSFFIIKDLSKLEEIQISKQNQRLVLFKKNQDWYLKKPIKDVASFAEVSRWFDEIKNQEVREISLDDDIVWSDYYIGDHPKVDLKFSDKSSVDFIVSAKPSFDEKYFIKKGNKLFIGEKYFGNEIHDKDFNSFRNKKLIPPYGHPAKVVTKGRENLSFNWRNSNWMFKKADFPLDEKRLDRLWSDLSSMEALSIKEKVTAQSVNKYGLQQPVYQIHLFYDRGEEKKKTKIQISALKNDKAYVYASHRNYILEISEEDFKKIKISKKDIRDHSQPFRYQKERASSLELKSKQASYELILKNNKWISLSSKDQLDSKKVLILLNSIYELKGKKYKKGVLQKEAGSIVIKDKSGKTLLDFRFSDSSRGLVWIQTNLSKDLVAITKPSLKFILDKNIYLSAPNKALEASPNQPTN